MKRIFAALVASSLLAGCAPSCVGRDAYTLSDGELCSRVGYGISANSADTAKSAFIELKARKARNTLLISEDECNMYADFGATDAREVAEKRQAMAQGMAQQQAYQQQQQMLMLQQRPVTTHCNSLGNNTTCSTF